MDLPRIKEYAQALNTLVIKTTPKRALVRCVFAPWKHSNGEDRNPSANISIKPNGESYYSCYSCNSKGNLYKILLDVRELVKDDSKQKKLYNLKKASKLVVEEEEDAVLDIPDYESDEGGYSKSIIPWDESYLTDFKPVAVSNKARKYLLKRGVTPDLWSALELRYDTFGKRICFPVRDFEGRLTGMRGRDITDKSELRYLAYTNSGNYNPQVWMREHAIDMDDPVILTESVFDVASILRVHDNVAASFSCSISQGQAKRMRGCLNIVTLYDAGNGGDIARKFIEDYYSDSVVQHIVPTKKQDDAGNMSVKKLRKALDKFVYLK